MKKRRQVIKNEKINLKPKWNGRKHVFLSAMIYLYVFYLLKKNEEQTNTYSRMNEIRVSKEIQNGKAEGKRRMARLGGWKIISRS